MHTQGPGPRSVSALLQLLRPPNLFTVPGDPLCGALILTGGVWSWRIVPPVIISLAAYCAGLVVNDLADYKEDLRDRPGRPLPSKAVPIGTAVTLALSFAAVAIALAAWMNAGLLLLTALLLAEILWYNLLAKRNRFIGPIAMGLCRGLSVLVGAAAFAGPSRLAMLAAAVMTLYIAGVTALARTETSDPRIPPLIGRLIRALLLIQAAFCVLAGGHGWVGAVVLLALWPLSRLVAFRFYAS